MLFSLISFLLPTIVAYHGFLSLVRLVNESARYVVNRLYAFPTAQAHHHDY